MSDGTKQNPPERRPIKVRTDLHSRVKSVASLLDMTLEDAGDKMAELFLKKFSKSAAK